MLIREIPDVCQKKKVMIFQTCSPKLDVYVMNVIRGALRATQDYIIEVSDAGHLRKVKEIYNIVPFDARQWLVVVDVKKLGKKGISELIQTIRNSSTCFFCCRTVSYSEFKDLHGQFKKRRFDSFSELYLSRFKLPDFMSVYNAFVPANNALSPRLLKFVRTAYAGDIESILQLFEELASGKQFGSQKEIVDLIGLGGNTVESFVLSLLGDPPKTAKGIKTVLRNRCKAAVELAEIFGYSKLNGQMVSKLKLFTDIKILVTSGEVYNHLSHLPDGYDEQKLTRYQRHLRAINKIPMSRMLRLMFHLTHGNRWHDALEFFSCLYSYYKELLEVEVVPFIHVPTEAELQRQAIEEARQEVLKQQRLEAEFDRQHKIELARQYGVRQARQILAQEAAREAQVDDSKCASNTDSSEGQEGTAAPVKKSAQSSAFKKPKPKKYDSITKPFEHPTAPLKRPERRRKGTTPQVADTLIDFTESTES